MELTFNQIYDYAKCPLIFKFRHMLGIEIPTNLYEQFDKALIKSILYFYYRIMDGGTVITSHQLKKRWEAFWGEEDFNPQEFILTPVHGNTPAGGHKNRRPSAEARRRSFLLRGWSVLNNFHRNNKDNPGTPVAVDLGFTAQLGNHQLSDTIDLARRIDDKTEIVILNTRQSPPDDFDIRNDLKTTFQVYGFRNIFNTTEDLITYYYLEKGKKMETVRVQRDFDRMESIIDNIVRAIELDIWFPRQTFYCNTCHFQGMCTQWEGG